MGLNIDWPLTFAVSLPLGLGALAGWMTRDETKGEWYRSLRKPWWQPPATLFAPVWTTLYILMGIASWRVWRAGGGEHSMALYAVQLALNIAWSFLFFKAKNLDWALFDITALLGVLLATTSAFYRVDRTAGYLMLPYVAWVSFATVLTATLYASNPGKHCRQSV